MKKLSYLLTALVILSFALGTFSCGGGGEQAPGGGTATPTPTPGGQDGALTITVSPEDSDSLFDLSESLFAIFSKKVAESDFSFSIQPDPGGWETVWMEEGVTVELKHSNPFQAAGEYQLTVSLRDTGQSKSVKFTAYGPSSLDLIDEAEASGELDLNEAWTYRLQALFEPSKLPDQYRSPTPIVCGTPVMLDFDEVKGSLRPETLEKLEPYLVRPTDPESVFSQGNATSETSSTSSKPGFSFVGVAYAAERPPTEGWYKAMSSKDPITVWSRSSQGRADEVLGLIEGRDMYGEFQSLLGREPLSDLNEKKADGSPNNGGEADLDIYLVPLGGALGACHYIHGGQTTPCWILIRETLSGAKLGSTLAHELFHAFQFAIDKNEGLWWLEGTATWAMDYIGKEWDTEHEYVKRAFDPDAHTLKPITGVGKLHEYGIYILPYYLSSKYGDEIIADIWKDCEVEGDNALDAVRIEAVQASDSDFNEVFKGFALLNWNDTASYSNIPPPRYPEVLNVWTHHGKDEIQLKEEEVNKLIMLPQLSALYVNVHNAGIDVEKTPSVTFCLEAFTKHENVGVQAVIYGRSDVWVEDWTGKDSRTFCLNKDEGYFTDIAIVFSNAESKWVQENMGILLGPECCGETWQLEMTYTEHWNVAGGDRDYTLNLQATLTQTQCTPCEQGNVTLAPIMYQFPPCNEEFFNMPFFAGGAYASEDTCLQLQDSMDWSSEDDALSWSAHYSGNTSVDMYLWIEYPPEGSALKHYIIDLAPYQYIGLGNATAPPAPLIPYQYELTDGNEDPPLHCAGTVDVPVYGLCSGNLCDETNYEGILNCRAQTGYWPAEVFWLVPLSQRVYDPSSDVLSGAYTWSDNDSEVISSIYPPCWGDCGACGMGVFPYSVTHNLVWTLTRSVGDKTGTLTCQAGPTPPPTPTPTPAPTPSPISTPEPSSAPSPAGASNHPFPMVGHDPQQTNRSPYYGPDTPQIEWSYNSGDSDFVISGQPVIAADGTVYVAWADIPLTALNPDGTLKWKYEFTGSWESWRNPTIGADGTIYIRGEPRKLYALNPDGSDKWQYKVELGNYGYYDISDYVTVGSDGTIYFVALDQLFALNPNGTLKWMYDAEGELVEPPVIGSDGTIYVYSDQIYAINSKGQLKWTYDPPSCVLWLAAAAAGTIYAGCWSEVYAINPDGSLKWSYDSAPEKPFGLETTPAAIGADGTLYLVGYLFPPEGDTVGSVCAIGANGSLKWTYELPYSFDNEFATNPIIDAGGTIYVGFKQGKILAIGSNGQLRWSQATGEGWAGPPVLGADGTIYTWCNDGNLYAIGE